MEKGTSEGDTLDGEAKRRQMPQYIHNGPVPLREGQEDRVNLARCWLYKRRFDRVM